MNDLLRVNASSTIGIRAIFTCAICRQKQTTYQIVDVQFPSLDLPRGWRMRDGRTYCPDNAPGLRICLEEIQ